MHGWEPRVLVKHYLEQGLTKAAIAERVGVSRRTIHYWLASSQLDRPIDRPSQPSGRKSERTATRNVTECMAGFLESY